MGRTRVQVIKTIRAPRHLVFERISDHEDMRKWPGINYCRLITEGEPRNGLGAVRAIRGLGPTLHEEVVFFDPPNGFDYKIIKGAPVDHFAKVRLTEVHDQTRIEWTIEMSSRILLLAQLFGAVLRRGLPIALAYFKRETEKAAIG